MGSNDKGGSWGKGKLSQVIKAGEIKKERDKKKAPPSTTTTTKKT